MSLTVNFYLKDRNMFIRLIGEMDQDSVGNLREKLIEIIEEHKVKNLIINMQKLEFMDSTGIGIIIGRYNQIKKKDGKLILCNINKNVEKIIMLCGLTRICEIKNNEEEASIYLGRVYG